MDGEVIIDMLYKVSHHSNAYNICGPSLDWLLLMLLIRCAKKIANYLKVIMIWKRINP